MYLKRIKQAEFLNFIFTWSEQITPVKLHCDATVS